MHGKERRPQRRYLTSSSFLHRSVNCPSFLLNTEPRGLYTHSLILPRIPFRSCSPSLELSPSLLASIVSAGTSPWSLGVAVVSFLDHPPSSFSLYMSTFHSCSGLCFSRLSGLLVAGFKRSLYCEELWAIDMTMMMVSLQGAWPDLTFLRRQPIESRPHVSEKVSVCCALMHVRHYGLVLALKWAADITCINCAWTNGATMVKLGVYKLPALMTFDSSTIIVKTLSL